MIIGVGCDLERIAALEVNTALHTPGVVFTETECGYAARQPHPVSTLAGNFAAKEAFFKSFDGGVPFYWTDVEVVHDARHAPHFSFSGEIGGFVREKGWDVKLSISHSGEYATAFVAISGGA